ncbi:uncharacterized protein LOC118434898 [Folsomia candida]|nr:uncharacterized protein LOC118434898 [Folsomia candida]
MVKRETHQRGKGRSFFGGPGQNLIIFNQTANLPENSPIIYDEDYSPINSSADGNTTKGGISDAIASEIWNFLEAKLDDILGLKVADNDTLETAWTSTSDVQNKPNRRRRGALWGKKSSTAKKSSLVKLKTEQNIQTLKPYKSPLYQFLELAKELMKRTCPAGYVNPDFFDLAVSTFIKIQNKHLRFPESAKNVKAKTRIVESLQSCIENATEFNFTIDPCSEKALHIWPVSGLYCAFGNCSLEINMYGGFENYEPIVETTWQIFKNAHSYCFDHFSKYYNDHHRFTTWMINLFQNPINDIWRNGTATGIVYGGVFGNQENVQTAVAYCAASSQLLSKYPWDLPRPEKIEELSNPATRKKRQVFEQGYDKSAKCLPSHEIPICE